jgi:hypothetical protein
MTLAQGRILVKELGVREIRRVDGTAEEILARQARDRAKRTKERRAGRGWAR